MSIELKDYDPALMQGANVGVSVDLTDITDMNGNELIELDGVTSAVNYLRVTNAITTGSPVLSARGDDDNVDLSLMPKGTGVTVIGTGAANATLKSSGDYDLILKTGNSTTSSITITDGAAGDITLAPDATGSVVINNGTDPVMLKLSGAAAGFNNEIVDLNGNEILALQGVTSAVNELTIVNAVANAAPALAVQGGDANIGLQLTPKGTSTVLLGNLSTGVVSAGAVTINAQRGVINTAGLTTGTGAVTAIDFINNKIWPSSVLMLTLVAGTNTGGMPQLGEVTLGSGSCTVRIVNLDPREAGTALNGSVSIHFVVLN